jgi:hypothetical protein
VIEADSYNQQSIFAPNTSTTPHEESGFTPWGGQMMAPQTQQSLQQSQGQQQAQQQYQQQQAQAQQQHQHQQSFQQSPPSNLSNDRRQSPGSPSNFSFNPNQSTTAIATLLADLQVAFEEYDINLSPNPVITKLQDERDRAVERAHRMERERDDALRSRDAALKLAEESYGELKALMDSRARRIQALRDAVHGIGNNSSGQQSSGGEGGGAGAGAGAAEEEVEEGEEVEEVETES